MSFNQSTRMAEFSEAGATGNLLLAFNRPDHIRRVLQGLESNGVTSFHIHIEAAVKSADLKAQERIHKLLDQVQWAKVVRKQHTEHQGLVRAVVGDLNEMFQCFGQVVFLEDDCIPRPGAIAFFNRPFVFTLTTHQSAVSVAISIPGFAVKNCPLRPRSEPDSIPGVGLPGRIAGRNTRRISTPSFKR